MRAQIDPAEARRRATYVIENDADFDVARPRERDLRRPTVIPSGVEGQPMLSTPARRREVFVFPLAVARSRLSLDSARDDSAAVAVFADPIGALVGKRGASLTYALRAPSCSLCHPEPLDYAQDRLRRDRPKPFPSSAGSGASRCRARSRPDRRRELWIRAARRSLSANVGEIGAEHDLRRPGLSSSSAAIAAPTLRSRCRSRALRVPQSMPSGDDRRASRAVRREHPDASGERRQRSAAVRERPARRRGTSRACR